MPGGDDDSRRDQTSATDRSLPTVEIVEDHLGHPKRFKLPAKSADPCPAAGKGVVSITLLALRPEFSNLAQNATTVSITSQGGVQRSVMLVKDCWSSAFGNSVAEC
jgi:hypothetical protein